MKLHKYSTELFDVIMKLPGYSRSNVVAIIGGQLS